MKQSTYSSTWFLAALATRQRKPMGIVVLEVDCVSAPPADRETLSD